MSWRRDLRALAAALRPGEPVPVPDGGITVEAGQVVARIIVTTPSGGLTSTTENVEMAVGGETLMRFWCGEDETRQFDVGFRLASEATFTKSDNGLVAMLVIG